MTSCVRRETPSHYQQFADAGARKVTGFMRGKEIDLTANVAAEYRYKARNLIVIIEVYERLHAPAEASAESASPSSSPTLPVSLQN
jgi:hypothetical protein